MLTIVLLLKCFWMCNDVQHGAATARAMQWPDPTALRGGFFLFVDWDFLYFCEVVAHKSGIVTATPEGVRTVKV